MNISYLIAALFAVSLTASHVVAGEGFFFKGIREYPKTMWGDGDTTIRLMKGAWHMLSWVMLGSAGTLLVMALTDYIDPPSRVALSWLLILGWTGATVSYLRYALSKPEMLRRAPIWINTLGTVAFTWLGIR